VNFGCLNQTGGQEVAGSSPVAPIFGIVEEGVDEGSRWLRYLENHRHRYDRFQCHCGILFAWSPVLAFVRV